MPSRRERGPRYLLTHYQALILAQDYASHTQEVNDSTVNRKGPLFGEMDRVVHETWDFATKHNTQYPDFKPAKTKHPEIEVHIETV